MTPLLRRLFTPSFAHPDPAVARTAELLHTILVCALLLVGGSVVLLLTLDRMAPAAWALNGGLFAGLVVLLAITHRGHVGAARYLTLALFFVYATVAVFTFGGLTTGPLNFFLVLVLLASVLGSTRLTLVTILASIVPTGLALVLMEHGRLPEPLVHYTPARTWVVFLASLGGLAALVGVSRRRLLAVVEALEREVAARREAERELQRSQQLLTATLDNTFELQGLLSPDGTLLEVNRTALTLIGVSRESVLGRPFWDTPWWTHDPELQARVREAIARARLGEIIRLEASHRAADGGTRRIDFTIRPVHDEHGQVVYLVPEGHDVTDLETAAEALRQSQRMEMVGRLAGGVAHDFNNLLVPVLGYAQVLAEELHSDDPRRQMACAIEQAAGRAAALTRQLLAFSRQRVVATTVFELDAVIRGFEPIVRRTIRENVAITVRLDAPGATVSGDVSQIEQLLLNLAVNARDAMPDGGSLEIATCVQAFDESLVARHPGLRAGRGIRLTVRDTGCGIPATDLPRIFEPFFTTRAEEGGSGMGLATVYAVVQRHGGAIDVTSAPGAGTRFDVLLPRAAATAAAAADGLQARPAAMAGRGTLAVVEDNEAVRDLVARLLQRFGYDVHEFASPADCLRAFDTPTRRIDLLVTDMVMPGMNGRELFRQLAASRPGLRVLYVSGYAREVLGDDHRLEPGESFLQKPFSMESLGTRVRDALATAA